MGGAMNFANADGIDADAEMAAAREEVLAGDGVAALDRLDRLARGPGHPLQTYWRAAALGAAGRWDAHRQALREAQDAHVKAILETCDVDLKRLASDQAYALQVATTFYEHNHVGVSGWVYAQLLSKPGAPFTALVSYGLCLQHQGRAEEAADIFERAYTLSGQAPSMHSFLLYSLFYVKDGVRRHAEAARRWAEAFPPAPGPECFSNRPLEGRKLRIGYYAPSVGSTQTRQFILPVLENHDAEAVEVFVYLKDAPGGELPPQITPRVVGGVDDAAMAQLVRDDKIDVFVDLWGHTANSRLGAFALKPAPVQVSWMNYVQTTGLAAIDYVLHADGMAEPGAQDQFVEKIWLLGPALSPFRPDPRPDPTPTPAKANGYVTFGSYNHPARLNDETVAAWAAILKRTPSSELVLRYRYFEDALLQNATLMRFGAHGVDPERITFKGHCVQPEYYQSYGEIDIALDPSPCPGGTTNNDALANGMPVLTLKGGDFFARIGSALVEPACGPELVTESWDEYVDRAVELASDVAALDALRLRVRVGFDSFPGREPTDFTRHLEAVFRDMYLRWQEERSRRAA